MSLFNVKDLAVRATKTIAEVAAALGITLQTSVPHPVPVIIVGSGVLAVAVNAAEQWFVNTKSAKLDKIAAAIDAAVDARLAKQGVADPAVTSVTTP